MIRHALAPLLALAALTLARPCEAAIGTPTTILAFDAPGGGPPTISNATTVDAPAGSLIVIYVAAFNAGDTTMATSCALSNGDTALRAATYTPVVASYSSALYYVSNSTHDLPIGSTISCNSGANQTGFAAWVITGTNGGLDKTASEGGVGTVSLSTGTLSSANELVFGSVNVGAGQTVTEASGFTTLVAYGNGTTNADIAYQIVSATSSVTYNPSFCCASGGGANLATFEATGSAIVTRSLMILGVGR